MSKLIGAKRSQKNHNILLIQHAVHAVQSKAMSLRAASKHYGIPSSTLHDKVHGKTPMSRPSKTVLTTAEEQKLVDWVLHMARIGYGRTRQEVLDTVKRIIDADNRPNPFTDNRPGKDWWYGLIKRHPEMTERLPQSLGKERAIITQAKVQRWFEEFEHYVRNEVKDPTILQDPSRLYNADESGFSLCPKSGKVIARKGSSTVYHFTSSDKTQITVLACMSATGHFLKPLIVYPGQRFAYNPLEGFPEAVMGRTENGWMDSDLFATWLIDVFIPSVNERAVRKPVVLFVDGHSTHVSMRVSDICRQGGIELYCLLEHASHLMQPCDLRLFSVLKDSWKQAVRDYQFQNIGEHVTKKTFASVFKTAWEKATTLSVAVHGFRDAGLFPSNAAKVLNTCKMDPSNIFHPQSTYTVGASGAADESQVLPAAQENSNNAPNLQEGQIGNTEIPSEVIVTASVDIPLCVPSTPSTVTAQDRSDDLTPQISPAVDILLKIPAAKPSEKRPLKKESKHLPKAITGEKFRKILEEKRKRREQEEADKQERKRQRELRKQKKDEERKHKLEQKEAKKKAREEQRQLKIQKKRQKQVEKHFLKRKRKESESSSDSDVDMSGLSDGSDVDMDFDVTRKCYICEELYDDTIFWIACNKCPRMFHRRCVKTIDLCAMSEDEIEALQFECDFC